MLNDKVDLSEIRIREEITKEIESENEAAVDKNLEIDKAKKAVFLASFVSMCVFLPITLSIVAASIALAVRVFKLVINY